MNLAQLQELGGLVSDKPVEKVVKFAGKEFKVHVLPQSFGAMEDMVTAAKSQAKAATFIHTAIRLDGGKEAIPYDVAYAMAPALAQEFIRVINEVHAPAESETAEKN